MVELVYCCCTGSYRNTSSLVFSCLQSKKSSRWDLPFYFVRSRLVLVRYSMMMMMLYAVFNTSTSTLIVPVPTYTPGRTAPYEYCTNHIPGPCHAEHEKERKSTSARTRIILILHLPSPKRCVSRIIISVIQPFHSVFKTSKAVSFFSSFIFKPWIKIFSL